MPPRLDDGKRAAILDDIREGGTCRGIARAHDVDPTTVSNIAKEAGIDDAFRRGQTKTATEARQADNRAKRATEAAESINVAAQLRDKILTAAHGRDAQGWATAYGIMADKHVMFDDHDSDSGASGAASLLGSLDKALTAMYEQNCRTPEGE